MLVATIVQIAHIYLRRPCAPTPMPQTSGAEVARVMGRLLTLQAAAGGLQRLDLEQ